MPWSLRLCRCLERRCTEGRLIYRQSGRLCVLGHAPEHKGNKRTTDVLRKPDKLISYRHWLLPFPVAGPQADNAHLKPSSTAPDPHSPQKTVPIRLTPPGQPEDHTYTYDRRWAWYAVSDLRACGT